MPMKPVEVLSADGDETTPHYFDDRATLIVSITGTITVTPYIGGTSTGPWIAKTASAITASDELVLDGPGYVKLVASSVSGGSAQCFVGVR